MCTMHFGSLILTFLAKKKECKGEQEQKIRVERVYNIVWALQNCGFSQSTALITHIHTTKSIVSKCKNPNSRISSSLKYSKVTNV